MHTEASYSQLQSVKWVFFDLDDTLWDFSSNSLESLKWLYNQKVVLKKIFIDEKLFIDSYHEVNASLWDRYSKGEISSEFLQTERFEALLRHRIHESHHLSIMLNREYLLKLSSIPKVVEGAYEALNYLSGKYLIGIITNGFIDTQYRKLKFSGLQKYIQRMIVSEEIGIPKPQTAIFDYAMAETGASAQNSVMVGDNISTDIIGAYNAGLKTFHLCNEPKRQPGLSGNITIPSLVSLRNYL